MLLLKNKFESNIMKLKLEKISSKISMKITQEKLTYFYLHDNGFTHNEIEYIKKQSKKEGIKFCVKTFTGVNLQEEKNEIREQLENKKYKKVKEIFNNFIECYSKNSY